MIFQQFNLVNRLDVLTNVLVGRLGYHPTIPTLLKVFSRSEKAMAIQALDELDMAATALQRADTLSGGQQQRVAIARALINEPRLLLADEPTGNLDSTTGAATLDLLARINRDHGLTVVMATHSRQAAATASRVVRLQDGQLASTP